MPRKKTPPQDDLLIQDKTEVQKPAKFKVLLHNDDYTPMDFVVYILENFFEKNGEEANRIMLLVHNTGLGICGVFPREIAETKVHQVTEASQVHEHPLRCTMEKA
jgi:ATP-dependent Clp protease adaptor protein ClpS